MGKVYAIGETVLDIIFKGTEVKEAKPGGAMLNCSVSLGRAGLDISLITEFADDRVGKLVGAFLAKNRVDCQHVFTYDKGKTPLALAFLDDRNDASYVFYKSYPGVRLSIDIPRFTGNDILLFGSFYGIDPEIREKLLLIVHKAREAGTLILYDPNFRAPHAHELEKLRPYILENMRLADIVRGSDEDFQIIFGTDSLVDVRALTGNKPFALIMTKSSSAVFIDAPGLCDSFPVKEITPVSTIGAGDNFNAGIIFGLSREKTTRKNLHLLTDIQWKKIIESGIGFASDVCMSYENYISEDYSGSLVYSYKTC